MLIPLLLQDTNEHKYKEWLFVIEKGSFMTQKLADLFQEVPCCQSVQTDIFKIITYGMQNILQVGKHSATF
jgi:hypothetical protein